MKKTMFNIDEIKEMLDNWILGINLTNGCNWHTDKDTKKIINVCRECNILFEIKVTDKIQIKVYGVRLDKSGIRVQLDVLKPKGYNVSMEIYDGPNRYNDGRTIWDIVYYAKESLEVIKFLGEIEPHLLGDYKQRQ